MKVILAKPRGFCAGVERAIEIVERALEKYGAPVYVRHEIVHNRHVVDSLRAKGARFVDELDEIPPGGITVFSAHGVSQKVEDEAILRSLPIIDATCPLVSKVHHEAQRYADSGRDIVLIGHDGHPEVEGTMGRIDGKVYVTQTTLSVDDTRSVIDALKSRFPQIVGPDTRDICYATQNRQRAVRDLAQLADVILVVGAQNSSNSNRLKEIAAEIGIRAYLIADASALDPEWLSGAESVGVTAGASAPEHLVQELVERLRDLGATEVEILPGVEENVRFKMPPELADAADASV